MISSVLALIAAVGGGQSDTTRPSREAFTNCLRAYVDRKIEDRMAIDAFRTEYAQQCTAQETAYREAVIRSFRGNRAEAEELAGLEIEDARASFRDLFEMTAEDTDRRQREVDAQATAQAQQPAPTAQPAADQAPAAEQPQQPPPTR